MAAVIVGAVLLILAIPVGGFLLAIAAPNFLKARNRALQQEMSQQAPTLVIRGTVTDAVTGKPIEGARVDDNSYGSRVNHPSQQAWTDANGHYELRTWPEEHNLAASAPGYQTQLSTLLTQGSGLQKDGKMEMDFQLQPAEAGDSAASQPEMQALARAVKRGSDAWRNGDYSKALALLLPAALKGDPVAEHRVGVMYVNGQGVETDLAEATRWFRRAAEHGQAESQYSLGLRYQLGESVGQDNEEAARWFKLGGRPGRGRSPSGPGLTLLQGRGRGTRLLGQARNGPRLSCPKCVTTARAFPRRM